MKIVLTITICFGFACFTGCTAIGITIGHLIGTSIDQEIVLSPDSLKLLSQDDRIIIQMKNEDIHSGYFSSFSINDKGDDNYSDTTKIEFQSENLNEIWQIRIKEGQEYFNYSGSKIKKIEITEKNYIALIPVIIGLVIDISILSSRPLDMGG